MKEQPASAMSGRAARIVLVGGAVVLIATGLLFITGATRSPVGASGAIPAPPSTSQLVMTSTVQGPAQQTTDPATATPKTTTPKTPAPAPATPKTTTPKTAAAKPTAPTTAPSARPTARATTTVAPQPAPAPIESLLTGRKMYAVAQVNVRDAPGTEGTTVISRLGSGAVVTAGKTADGWVPVRTDKTFGWVSADFLADGTPPPAPAAQPDPPAQPDQPQSGNWMTDLLPQIDPGGAARWEFWRNGGWGATDGHTVYIDPDVPEDKRFSVMIHEYSHVLQVQVYGSIDESAAAMSARSGMSATAANESMADCMALMQGATWVDYGCQDSLRGAAEAVLAGHRP